MLYIAILCKTDDRTAKTTEKCLESIQNSVLADCVFNKTEVYIVESGNQHAYNCKKIIQYDKTGFNYNHACNLAIDCISPKMKNSDWLCIMNNDIVCDKMWLQSLENAVTILPTIQSMCPNAGNVQDDQSNIKILLGYALKKTFNGCCFMLRQDVVKKLGKFDEQFDFYFQDDDLLEQLKINNIQHGLIVDSKIHHIGQDTTRTEDIDKLAAGALTFIKKYSLKTYLECEHMKNINI